MGLSIVAVAAAVVAVYALFQAFDARMAPPIVIEDAAGLRPVVVDVRGAVGAPGVYELPPGSRVHDAILAAGGLNPEADLSTINLARRLRDEEVVVILQLPEPGSSPEIAATDAGEEAGATDLPERININTATLAELDLLPGVGEITAERIVHFREENGPYPFGRRSHPRARHLRPHHRRVPGPGHGRSMTGIAAGAGALAGVALGWWGALAIAAAVAVLLLAGRPRSGRGCGLRRRGRGGGRGAWRAERPSDVDRDVVAIDLRDAGTVARRPSLPGSGSISLRSSSETLGIAATRRNASASPRARFRR